MVLSDASDGSSSESDDVATTGLIATRAKRAGAGNRMDVLLENYAELEDQLLEDEEGDEGDFEGSDKDKDSDEDADALSSDDDDDDEDAGPPQQGDNEDLDGEKELKREERERRIQESKKRKADEAKLAIGAAWKKQQKKKKKVTLADNVKAEDGASTPKVKPKKKSERQDWRPADSDQPTRQSSRSTAVANRETVHANLEESVKRSQVQKERMAKYKKREEANARMMLTQEQRFEKAARIEKETAKEFGRWEREEAERQRLREEALAAKRRRGIDGPVIRHWSGSVLWEGDKIEDDRLHGSQKIDEIKDRPMIDVEMEDTGTGNSTEYATASGTPAPPSVPATPGFAGSRPLQTAVSAPQPIPAASADPSFLDGIDEYAHGSGTSTPGAYTPSAPANYTPSRAANGLLPLAPQSSSNHYTPNQPVMYHGLPPYNNSFNQSQVSTPTQQIPPIPAVPLIKQQAQRSLVMLEAFDNLDTSSKKRTTKDATLDPTPIASTLLPLSYPKFTPDEARYLTSKRRSTAKDAIPAPPTKARCALTPFAAKFRDPKTGVPYAGLMEYKMIQRMLARGTQWSGVLGAYVGPTYGEMGRAAKGVPDGFGG